MKNTIKALLLALLAFNSYDCFSKTVIPAEKRVFVPSEKSLHEIILNQSLTFEQKIRAIQHMLDNKIVDINDQDANGKTALNFAIYYKADPELINFLIGQGSDVNIPDHFNVTPLFNAVKYDQLLAAQLLLDRGAERNFRTDEGLTADGIASRTAKAKALLRLYEQNEANISA